MAINNTQVAEELGAYLRKENKLVEAMFYAQTQLLPYVKTITKVQGRYPALHSVTNHLVQGFTDDWSPMGDTKFRAKELVARHIKVNYEFKPSDIRHSWLGELYNRKMSRAEMPISKYLVDKEMLPKVQEDIAILEIAGTYDANQLDTFGYALSGIDAQLTAALAETGENTVFRINIPTLTPGNMVDGVTEFEKQIPEKMRSRITKIFMSYQDYYDYILDYENTYGQMTNFTDQKKVRTRLGMREIVPLNYMQRGRIWTTVDGNILRLVDYENSPEFTETQVYNYTVKVFLEGWLGYDFAINQLVLCSSTYGNGSGLANDNDSYYANGI